MNSIILIDDNQVFINDFTSEAYARGITVAPAKSLEGLKRYYLHLSIIMQL